MRKRGQGSAAFGEPRPKSGREVRGQFATIFVFVFGGILAMYYSVAHSFGTYEQSKHGGVTNGARRPPGTPAGYATINATDFPAGQCIHCHDQHSSYTDSGTTYTHTPQDYLAFDTLNNNTLCNGCHDNTAQTYTFPTGSNKDLCGANLKWYWYKGSNNIAGCTDYTGFNSGKHYTDTRSTYNTWQGNTVYPANQWPSAPGRCLNCHDPHGSPLGSNMGGATAQASMPSNRALLDDMINDNNPEDRNKLCYSCHDKIVKDNAQTTANQQKFLGSEGFFQNGYKYIAHGKSDRAVWPGTSSVTEQWGGVTYTITNSGAPLPYWERRPQGDHGLCLNCHNPHTLTKTTNFPNGVPFYLVDDYKWTPDAATQVDPGSGQEWRVRLCIRCHSLQRLMGDGNSANDTHNNVNMAKQCNNCHNPHGYDPDAQYDNTTDTLRNPKTSRSMIYWNPATVTDHNDTPGTKGRWDPVNKSCKVTCDGQSHTPKTYKSDASLRQYNYRWYNDVAEGSLSTNAKAPENTPLLDAPTALGTFYRLRMQIGEATGTSETTNFKLQFSTDGSTWTDVAAQSATTAAWRFANSANATDNSAVTVLLLTATGLGSDGAGTFEEDVPHPDATVAFANQSREYDFVIEPYSASSNTRYIFRVVRNTGSTLITFYYNYPELLTAAGPPVTLQTYNYRLGKNDAATPGTFYALENTAYTLASGELNDTIRLRIQIGNQSGAPFTGQYFKLQYRRGDNESWFDVGKTGDGVEDWEYADSSFVSDKAQIVTRVLSAGALTPANGYYVESIPSQPFDLANNTHYEHDFIIKTVPGKIVGSTAYRFRVVSTNAQGTSSTPLATYNNTPQVTTPAITATIEQYNYRWYWDNTGTDANLSIGANQNTALTNAQLTGNYRLRVQVGESSGGSTGAKSYKLKYATAVGGPYSDLGAAAPWNFGISGNVTDGNTVQSLLLTPVSETNTHARGTYEKDNAMGAITLQKEDREFDFVIAPTASVAASTVYYFRVFETTDAALNTYNETAQLTTAAAGKGYSEGSESITLYSAGACPSTFSASNEIYPQWQSIATSSTIYVRVLSAATGPTTRTLQIFNFNNVQQGGTVNFNAGPSPYCASIVVPATAGQYYVRVQIFGGTGSFYSDGPVITVGATQAQYTKTYSDQDYATESNAFAPGDRVYVQMNSSTADVLGATSCNIVNFSNTVVAAPTVDDVYVAPGSDTSNYNLSFVMPSSGLTDGYWYSLQCTVANAAPPPTNLAIAPYKLIRYSSIRETRKVISEGKPPPDLQQLEAVPNPVYRGNAVKLYLTFKGTEEDAWADVYVDEIKEEQKKLALSIPREKGEALSFDLDTKDFEEGSSHAVFVKVRDAEEVRGVVLSVLPVMPAIPTDPQYTVSYFQDEELSLPFETPDGVPFINKLDIYPYFNFITPAPSGLTVHVDVPQLDQDVQGGNPQFLGNGNLSYRWCLIHSVEGVAKVSLGDAYAEKLYDPQSGGMVNLFSKDGYYLSLSALPDVIEADGKSQSTISAKLLDAKKKPVSGVMLNLHRFQGGGTLQTLNTLTDFNGEAKAVYTSGLTADTVEIRAEDVKTGNIAHLYLALAIRAETEITLLAPAVLAKRKTVDPYFIILSAYPSAMPADGVSTSKIIAKVMDNKEQKAAGLPLVFEIISGTGTFLSSPQAQTNQEGEAEVLYQAGNAPGEVVIRVTQPESNIQSTITLTLTTGGPAKIYITAEPKELPADGISQSQLKILVTNLFNTPLSNVSVTLSLSSQNGLLSTTSGKTDSWGILTVVYTAGIIPEKVKIMAVVVSEKPK